MSVVSFERIRKIYPGDARTMDAASPDSGDVPLGDLELSARGSGRTTLYDDRWGYFLFGQEIDFEFQDTDTYISSARFTIEGRFTRNAEFASREPTAGDIASFTALVARYTALQTLLEACGRADAPADLSQWGTAADPRCIALPAPLLDKSGNLVYAIPEELTAQPGQWPFEIAYRCTLREAKFPAAKLIVNNAMLDGAVVTITYPKPMMVRHSLVGCCGEVLQVKNYSATEIGIQGTVPAAPGSGERVGVVASGHFVGHVSREMIKALEADKVDVAVAVVTSSGTDVRPLWTGYDRVSPSPVDFDSQRKTGVVEIRCRE